MVGHGNVHLSETTLLVYSEIDSYISVWNTFSSLNFNNFKCPVRQCEKEGCSVGFLDVIK